LSQEGIRRLMPGRRGHGLRIHTTRQPRHASRLRLIHHYMRMLATCPARGASGHGRLTAGTPLLAVAIQFGIALVIPHPRIRHAPSRARVHAPRRAALLMGHLSGCVSHALAKQTRRPTLSVGTTMLLCTKTRRNMQASRRDSASGECRGLRMEVGVEGVIRRLQGNTTPPEAERAVLRILGCEG
jgi:hypothetical protein